jgi:hypothetical protein
MDGSRSPDRVAAQVGNDFSGPGPGCGLCAGHAERERADGPVSVSGRMAAWRAERGLRVSGSWAVFVFGPNFSSEQ